MYHVLFGSVTVCRMTHITASTSRSGLVIWSAPRPSKIIFKIKKEFLLVLSILMRRSCPDNHDFE